VLRYFHFVRFADDITPTFEGKAWRLPKLAFPASDQFNQTSSIGPLFLETNPD